MNQQGESGEKTENATPKRLRDARKKGDVAKSKDVTSTLVLAFAVAILWFTFSTNVQKLAQLLSSTLAVPTGAFSSTLHLYGTRAIETFITISATLIIPIALFGLLIEFLQTGPVFALSKLRPKLSNLNPDSGFKRMFSLDSVIDALQSIAKTCVLLLIAYLVVRSFLYELLLLPESPAGSIALALKAILGSLLFWTIGVFVIIMLLDWSYQRFAFSKKMRMSLREVREEQREAEGDPQLKRQRQQLHQELSQERSEDAARSATVLVVNPTHIAIALQYHKTDKPIPVISAKGEDSLAAKMRDAANEKHVPVLRNELLARTLLANVDVGSVVPKELFDTVAQIILWATKTTALLERERRNTAPYTVVEQPAAPPGENLTVYPTGYDAFKKNQRKQ